ncbi:MAG: hypothetical protein IID38_02950 [Planctomycetes bacterium]|nr:hypothetical protein [Planctomycetota bacterium]
MAQSVNKIRNADFSRGRADPTGWVWKASNKSVKWLRGESDGSLPSGSRDSNESGSKPAKDCVGIAILAGPRAGSADWSQTVVCRPGQYYRIEADVACELEAAGESDGFVLSVQPIQDGKPVGQQSVTPGLHAAETPTAVRTYYQVPPQIRRLRISVGLANARGKAWVGQVRFIRILEPDEVSHITAIPAPPLAERPPKTAGSVCICSEDAETRTITCLLREYYGESKVQTLQPSALKRGASKADALLLPDARPPSSIRSLGALLKLAADRIVVISLPAFAKLSKGALSLRRIEQEDDPIHAKVFYANHATRGFALQDTFAYAWAGRAAGSFVQNHFRKTPALEAFCKKHHLLTLLVSMCDREVTSDRPVCLYSQTSGGGLFVLDIEPLEAESSTMGEPALAMVFLLSVLGQAQTGLGQYAVPVRKEAELIQLVRDLSERFPEFVVHAASEPVLEIGEQLVTIGREDQSYGLPLKPKPVILVRSGLTSGDAEGVYGALIWFKQFIRMPPHTCPYAQALASRFRLAWVPCSAAWDAQDGWARRRRQPTRDVTLEFEDAEVAALIDVVSRPINRARVIVPQESGGYERYLTWLPRLCASFRAGDYFAPTVADGESLSRRDRCLWRHVQYDLQVVVDRSAFKSRIHQQAMAAGGQVVRIEVPAHDADFTAHSIRLTDLTATLLEHVIGLQYGLLAVNRRPGAVHFDGFPTVAPGDALIVDARDPMLRAGVFQTG